MTQEEANAAIFARWLSMWPTLAPSCPYAFDNIVKPESELFAFVGIVELDSEQWTLGAEGNRLWLRPGMIDIQLSGPPNQGRKPLDRLAGFVRTIFEGKRFARSKSDGGIVTHATSVSPLKKVKDSTQLWMLSVVTPFEYYETR